MARLGPTRAAGEGRRNVALFSLQILALVCIAALVSLWPQSSRRSLAADECPSEGDCTFRKPTFLFVLEYSSAMALPFDANDPFSPSRWDVARLTVEKILDSDAGFLQETMHLALLRYAGDSQPGVAGTTESCDPQIGSERQLVDGSHLDVRWHPAGSPLWYECNGSAVKEALQIVAPPHAAAVCELYPWTRGAMERAGAVIQEAIVDHDGEVLGVTGRLYGVMLLTSGPWTNSTGTNSGPNNDPAPAAAQLQTQFEAATHVVALSLSPMDLAIADSIAVAGGTAGALAGNSPQPAIDALTAVVNEVTNLVQAPVCDANIVHLTFVVDASSDTLNINDVAADSPGVSAWEQGRALISDLLNSIVTLDPEAKDLAELTLGAALRYGSPGEEETFVPYTTCLDSSIKWTLDPSSSCEPPSCTDPYSGPPVAWTQVDKTFCSFPGYVNKQAFSVMPACDVGDTPGACQGSASFLHLGLLAAQQAQAGYVAEQLASGFDLAATPFVNILVVSTDYTPYSTEAQVKTLLESAYGAGVTTYVMVPGGNTDAPLTPFAADVLAEWGSGGVQPSYNQDTVMILAQELASLYATMPPLGPCCAA